MGNYFENKVAVVTGAGGTLCSAMAIDLASKGAKVVLIGRTAEKLEKTAAQIREAGGSCMIQAGDVTDEQRMKEIAEKVKAEFGPCSFLINGAGGNQTLAMTSDEAFDKNADAPDARTFYDLDVSIMESVLKINTIGTVVPCRVFSQQMMELGGGSIINFASMNTYCPLTKVPAYAMAKAAVSNFTQWLAAYLGKTNIRVNAIAPGFFVNERSIKFLGTPETGLTPRGEKVIGHTPMERYGQAADLLGCMEWLLNDEVSGFVNGITVPVDGGFLSRSGI